MPSLKMSVARTLASLRESRLSDSLGAVGVVFGIVLVALGWLLEEEPVGIGAAIRTLGGIVFLAGLATVAFGDSRRRAIVIGMSKRILAGYMSRTAQWGWPDRWGLASVAIGVALIVPAVVFQIIFRNGALVAGPAVILFWVGIFLLICGRFRGRGEVRTRKRSSSLSHRGGQVRGLHAPGGIRTRNLSSSLPRRGGQVRGLHAPGEMQPREKSSSPPRRGKRDKRLQ